MRSGGDSRVAGVLLAAATFGVLVTGPIIIGYIPIMVVGALIFYLGFSLLQEALIDNWGRVHRLEYITVIQTISGTPWILKLISHRFWSLSLSWGLGIS